jgi:hypothetical protein
MDIELVNHKIAALDAELERLVVQRKSAADGRVESAVGRKDLDEDRVDQDSDLNLSVDQHQGRDDLMPLL